MNKILSSIATTTFLVQTSVATPFFGGNQPAYMIMLQPQSENYGFTILYANDRPIGDNFHYGPNSVYNWNFVSSDTAIEFSVFVPETNQWFYDGLNNLDNRDHMQFFGNPGDYWVFFDSSIQDTGFNGDVSFYITGLTHFPTPGTVSLLLLAGIISTRRSRR